MDDPYFDIVREYWSEILMVYSRFDEKKPVMLYDLQEQRIYAYPYESFKADLSARSQSILEKQYIEAADGQKIVVFVRDNARRKLVSYAVDKDAIGTTAAPA